LGQKSVIFLCLSVPCILSILTAVGTLQWPLIGDASLIHYVVFLLDSGQKPYSQIADVNLPGAYLVDWLVMHVFGSGALGGRLYDYLLSLISAWAAWRIAPERFRHAGIFAAGMFFLLHARDGAKHIGQRDWTMAVLVLLAMVAWLRSGANNDARLRFAAGCLIGFAAEIKPPALLFLLPLLLVTAWSSRDGGRYATARRAAVPLALGMTLPFAVCILWLMRESALHSFVSVGVERMRFHASLHRLPAAELIAHGISGLRVPILLAAALLPFAWKQLRSAEFRLLLGATAMGALCYLLQGKGHPYHRYAFAFLLLETVGVVCLAAISSQTQWLRWAGAAALGVCCLWLAPQMAIRSLRLHPEQDQFGTVLRADLQQLGGPKLDGNIQCLDTFSGCLRVLYELHLRQSTSTLYDEFLFGPSGNAVIQNNRAEFARQLTERPPTVLVMTPQNYSGTSNSYAKVESWPWFAEYLAANYQPCVDRTPTHPELWEGSPRVPLGYRLYVLKGLPSPLR